jgi:hypothetical protein
MKQHSNIRVAKVSVSPLNFINWNLLYATGVIKGSEEVLDVFDVENIKDGIINFKLKLKKDNHS